MKKIYLSILTLCLFSIGAIAQVLNQDANWPNPSWSLGGTYDPTYLLTDPTISATWSYDEDAAGSAGDNIIFAESPVIDLTAAHGAGEFLISVTTTYTFRDYEGEVLTIQYWDADAMTWNLIDTLPEIYIGSYDFQSCTNHFQTVAKPIDVRCFTPSQLSGFKYRIMYDDNQGWGYGICVTSPNIMSMAPPANDAMTVAVDPIASGCDLSSAQVIGATILNNGSVDITSIDMFYSINGGTPVGPETFNITITPLCDTTSISFSTTADLSGYGSYDIAVWTSLGGDGNATNDTAFTSVLNNMPPVVDLGADTSFCDGLPVVLGDVMGSTFDSYEWNDGSTNATLTINAAGDYWVTVTDNAGCQDVDTINASTIAFTPPFLGNDTSICDGTSLILDAGSYDIYYWSSGNTTSTETAMVSGTYSVSVGDLSTSCTAATMINIDVITPTSDFSMPTTFCEADDAITLTITPMSGVLSGAGVSGMTFDPMAATAGNYDIIYDYSVSGPVPYMINQSGTFNPVAGTGTQVLLGDDEVSSGLPIGFNFNFFGNTYNQFYISSNGFISFQDDGSGCCSGDFLPSFGTPANLIAYSWTDMDPDGGAAGDYDYFTVGSSPNQILVVNVNNVVFFGTAVPVTVQILLYEGTNIIEIHSTSIPLYGDASVTMGIQNEDGSQGYGVPGRNSTDWSATNDFVQFIPGAATVCYNADTVNVDVFASPVLELGMDTSICDPSIYTLDAGNSGSTYVWQDGSTNQTFDVDTTGQYAVTVTTPDACTAIDTINIVDIAAPIVDLGNDTTICIGNELTFDVSIPTATYAWNTGSTDAMITVTTSGQYTVSVTKCATTVDMVSVTVANLPTPDLGPDQLVCWDDTVSLDAGSYVAYIWDDGDTTQTNEIPMPKMPCQYTLEMYDSFGDGWNDNSFDIYENGNLITSLTLGDNSDSVAYITITPGASLFVNHNTPGGFPNEVAYYLYDGYGNFVDSVGLNEYSAPADSVWFGLAQCPTNDIVVTVEDLNGCINSDTVNLIFSNPMVDLGPDTTVCDGETYTVDAGTHASYLWSDGSTSQTIDLTAAGVYYVTVTDSIGCTKVDSIMFDTYSLPTVDLGNDTSICAGSTYMIDAGAGMMMYNWQDGWVSQMYPAMNDGDYAVTVTDNNGCMNADTVSVSTITVMVSTSVSDATCGNSDGEVTAMASAGMSTYTYMWNNGSTDANTTGLFAGLYTVTATDSYGCEGSASVNVVNADGPQVTSTSVTSNLCNGNSDGIIEITVAGGTSPYTYMWNDGQMTANASGLVEGTYDITIEDATGCFGYVSETLVDPTVLNINAISFAVSCNGESDGELGAMAMGGISPYSYVWDNGATDPLLSGLVAGDYACTVTDVNGCTASTSVTLGEPTTISLTTSYTDVSCNGMANGDADVTAFGGVMGYTYMWSNGATDYYTTGLVADTYDVTVMDANGCVDMTSVTISEPTALSSTVTTADATCGNNDGSASVAVSGGTSPYYYGWSSGGTSASESSLFSGNYTVTVMDDEGCMITDGGTIVNADGPMVVVNAMDPLCNNDMNGSAMAVVTGGTSPYTYMWNDGQSTDNATGLGAGSYDVTVTDNGGCEGYGATTLMNPTAVSISASATDETYSGADNGTATASAMGGSGSFTYAWSNGGTDAMISGLTPGSYTVTADDANGCSASTTVSVAASTVTCNLTASASATDATCNGDADGTATVTPAGAASSTTYDWSNGDNTAAISGLVAGTYTVTVTDVLGCTATASATVSEPSALFITLGPDSTICDTESMTLDPGAGFTAYDWSTGESTQAITVSASGTYSVTVSNATGCTATDDVVVTSTTCGGIDELSNVFGVDIYPNPSNGEFVVNINAAGNNECELMIYSVDGKLVYTENVQLAGLTTKAIDLNNIATGVYSLEVRTTNETSVQKLIIK